MSHERRGRALHRRLAEGWRRNCWNPKRFSRKAVFREQIAEDWDQLNEQSGSWCLRRDRALLEMAEAVAGFWREDMISDNPERKRFPSLMVVVGWIGLPTATIPKSISRRRLMQELRCTCKRKLAEWGWQGQAGDKMPQVRQADAIQPQGGPYPPVGRTTGTCQGQRTGKPKKRLTAARAPESARYNSNRGEVQRGPGDFPLGPFYLESKRWPKGST